MDKNNLPALPSREVSIIGAVSAVFSLLLIAVIFRRMN